jgi:hypothetical protein
LDLFTAYAAQHLAASAEVLLGQARNWPPDEVSRYLSNLRKLEQALRVLKRREYGDKRYLDLGHDQVWFLIDQLLSEHEQLESVVAARIAADSDWDALAILAENLMTSQTSAADDLEGPVVPALLAALEVRLYGHSRHPDAAGPHQAWDPRRSRRC